MDQKQGHDILSVGGITGNYIMNIDMNNIGLLFHKERVW